MLKIFFFNNSAIVISADGKPPSDVGVKTPGNAPVRIGYLPVNKPALDGVQTGCGAYQEVKSIPSLAKRSIFGVCGGGHCEHDFPYLLILSMMLYHLSLRLHRMLILKN